MPETPYAKFRLGEETMADLDALAASNGGTRSTALREAVSYWRRLVEEAGRENAEELTVEEWTILGHTQVGVDDLAEILMEESGVDRGRGRPVADTTVRDWSVRIAQEVLGSFEGRPVVLPIHAAEKKIAKKLAKKIAEWGIVRGFALYAALRYFWRHPEAGIAACAAPEVWMTPTARSES